MREERGREVCAGVVEGMEWFGWAIFCTFGGFFVYSCSSEFRAGSVDCICTQ